MAESNICQHHGVELNLFCEDCRVDVCLLCYTEDHATHVVTNKDTGQEAELEAVKRYAKSCVEKLQDASDKLEKTIVQLTENEKQMNEKIIAHFKEVRQKISDDEATLKEKLSKQTEMQQKRVRVELDKLKQKNKMLESIASSDNACQDIPRKKPTDNGTAATKMRPSSGSSNQIQSEAKCILEIAQSTREKPIFVPNHDFLDSLSVNAFGKVSFEKPKTAVRSTPLKRFTREKAPPPSSQRKEQPAKLLHSWETQNLESLAVNKDGLFTIAAGRSIAQYDIEGNRVKTLTRNIDILPSFIDHTTVSNQEHLVKYYRDKKSAVIEPLGQNVTDQIDETEEIEANATRKTRQAISIKLNGICMCVSTVEIQDDRLFYQKTIKGKRKQRNAAISIMDFKEGTVAEIESINLNMKMVRNFHCIKNSQSHFQLVVTNKDLWRRNTSHLVALKSFDRQGNVLWTIGREQLYTKSNFRYDLRSIASDRNHLYALDYSVGAVHMATHSGTYLGRVIQHLHRPTHLCMDEDRQRIVVAEDKKKISVYKV